MIVHKKIMDTDVNILAEYKPDNGYVSVMVDAISYETSRSMVYDKLEEHLKNALPTKKFPFGAYPTDDYEHEDHYLSSVAIDIENAEEGDKIFGVICDFLNDLELGFERCKDFCPIYFAVNEYNKGRRNHIYCLTEMCDHIYDTVIKNIVEGN